MSESQNVLDTVTVLAAIGCGLIGLAVLITAVLVFANTQIAGAGLALIAAALVFGQLMDVTSKR